MAEALPLSEGEIRLLGSLVRHRVPFMIVGLSAAALQGAPVVTQDVDLWVERLDDPRLARALKAVGAGYVPPFGLNPPMLAGAHTEPFDLVIRMDGLRGFADEIKQALEIRVGALRLKVLPLERILASKIAANRPKDHLVIPVLQSALRTLSTKKIRTTRAKKNGEPAKRKSKKS